MSSTKATKRRGTTGKSTARRTGGKKSAASKKKARKAGSKTSKKATASTRGSGARRKRKPRKKKEVLVVRSELFGSVPTMTGNSKRRFPAAEDTLESFLAYFPSFDLLTPDEERYFSRLARMGDELGRTRLIMHNIRLVASEALRYYNARIPDNTQIVSVITEGIFGLMKAVERFDPERGFRFSTYATHWIRRFIYRGSNGLRFIRLPHYIHGILARLPTKLAELEKKGKDPTPKEIAKALKEREGAYHLAVQAAHTTNIVKPTHTSEAEGYQADLSEDYIDACNEDKNAINPLDALIDMEMGERLTKALDTLSSRDRKVIEMRYGIGYKRTYTLQEIGNAVNLSRERIRQIENSSVKRLQEHFQEQGEDGR